MSDVSPIEPPEQPELDEPDRVADWAAPDEHLVVLVNMVNQIGGSELNIRLTVFGLVLSGKLIGGADYFDSVATIFDQASADSSESLGDVYRRTATFYRNDVRAQPGESRVTTFIHLKDAYAYAPGAKPLLIGLWRGRLGHVSGWSVGSYGSPPS